MHVALVNLTAGGMSGGYRKYLEQMIPLLRAHPSVSRLDVVSPSTDAFRNLGGEPSWFWRGENSPRGQDALQRRLNRIRPDVVFIPTARAVATAFPTVVMVRNMEPLVAPVWGGFTRGSVANLARRTVARTACARATRVIAVSQFVQDYLTHRWRIDESKIGVVYHGVNPISDSRTLSRPQALESLGDRPFLFTAGSIRPARGLSDLVGALLLLAERGSYPAIVIAGTASPESAGYRHRLLAAFERYGLAANVLWPGALTAEDMTWCFSNCVAFVMTSRVEACPNTALEALACGSISISTVSRPMPEIFADGALYYNPGDGHALAQRIETAMAMPDQMRAHLREKARARGAVFSWQNTAQRTVEELETTLGAKSELRTTASAGVNPVKRKPKVLVLTQVYAPEPNFITSDVAQAVGRDAEVVVVTAHPNYPEGKFYPGVKYWRISRTVEQGVTVWRLPIYPDHSLSVTRRALSYLSYAFVAGVVAPFVAGRPQVVWVYHGPFTTGLASLFFKAVYRSRLVFTCADLWPESFVAAGVVRSKALMSILAGYNRALNRAADLIICATRGTVDRMRREGISEGRLRLIPVWIGGIRGIAENADRARVEDAEPSIVYAGNLGPAQKLDTVIRGAAILSERRMRVSIDIFGTGASEKELRDLATDLGAVNVRFHGRVPVTVAFERSAIAIAQIICLQPSPLFRMTVPSKLSSAFAAGAPILYGLEGEAAVLMQESGGGIRFDPADAETFASAVEEVLAMAPQERDAMRARLQSYFRNNFEPATLIGKYRQAFGLPEGRKPRSVEPSPEFNASFLPTG